MGCDRIGIELVFFSNLFMLNTFDQCLASFFFNLSWSIKIVCFQLQLDILPGDLPAAHGGDDPLLPADGAAPLAGGQGDHWLCSSTPSYG